MARISLQVSFSGVFSDSCRQDWPCFTQTNICCWWAELPLVVKNKWDQCLQPLAISMRWSVANWHGDLGLGAFAWRNLCPLPCHKFKQVHQILLSSLSLCSFWIIIYYRETRTFSPKFSRIKIWLGSSHVITKWFLELQSVQCFFFLTVPRNPTKQVIFVFLWFLAVLLFIHLFVIHPVNQKHGLFMQLY